MLYILELEPLRERYTFWWRSYIPRQLQKYFNIEIISGESLTDKVETGTVLDAGSTCYWKSVQLQRICEKFYKKEIEPHSVFFVADIWFPGIEMIRYMSTLYNIPIYIYGVWHAGSSTRNDFAEPMHGWSKEFEIGFLNLCDGVFVGSEYSRMSIIERLLYSLPDYEIDSLAKRIHAYGMPLNFSDIQQYSSEEKENIVVFPHRPDPEKNPDVFVNLVRTLDICFNDFGKYKFVFCTSKEKYQSSSSYINNLIGSLKFDLDNVGIHENLSKEDYYTLIGKSKLVVSTTSEENFGYCAVEAMALGTSVLLPNNFSHPEIVENQSHYLYNNHDEMIEKAIHLLSTEYNYSAELKELVKPYEYVIDKWASIMKTGIAQ